MPRRRWNAPGPGRAKFPLDRYGHLMPGSEDEAAELLDAYLTAQREQAEEQARAADIGAPRSPVVRQ
jgi:hypothetical protein